LRRGVFPMLEVPLSQMMSKRIEERFLTVMRRHDLLIAIL
jgi:hypothetical protein